MTSEHDLAGPQRSKTGYNRFLLLVAGLGGLLYGVDVGIIAGALPYMKDTTSLNPSQLSIVVATVLLGSVISTLFAGMLSDLMGRKAMMIVSGLLFVVSVPVIAMSKGYEVLVVGRLLQGFSAGLIGVVVPLYLAECLGAANRGKGTGIFQWLLTIGILVAALIAAGFSYWLGNVEKLGDAQQLLASKDTAWRGIFWVSMPPGLLFVLGSFFVTESPRWLFRRGRKEAARNALLRSRTGEQADTELKEMETVEAEEKAKVSTTGQKIKESLLHRKYVIPFLLACIILACNQATGVNSIIGYNATILLQAGLNDQQAHTGYFILTVVNILMTMVAVALVDRKGRKFLLSLGSAGIILSLVLTGLIFQQTEKKGVDCKNAVQAMIQPAEQKASFPFNDDTAAKLLVSTGEAGKSLLGKTTTLTVVYSCGDFHAATNVVRSDDPAAKPVEISRDGCLPGSKLQAAFSNPFADLEGSKKANLQIENAMITPVPSTSTGWLTAICIYFFMAFFAVGPGVCVWLALSELMPTRIRSNGMSIALLLNQAVSTTIAAVFLPTVGKYGYATVFFAFAGFTVIYFVTAFFFLPETKGKTLEEIEAHFEGKQKA